MADRESALYNDQPAAAVLEVQHTRTVHGHTVAVVSISGDITAADAVVVDRMLDTELEAAVPVIVVDLEGVGRCDASAVEVLAVARARGHRKGINVHVLDRDHPVVAAQLAAATTDRGGPHRSTT